MTWRGAAPIAACDSRPGIDQRLLLHDGVDLSIEDRVAKVIQELLVLAENLEMHHLISHRKILLARQM